MGQSQVSGMMESEFDEAEEEDDDHIPHKGEIVMMMEDNSNIISVQRVVGSEETAFLVYPSPG